MAKNAYFGTDTGNFGTGTAMYADSNGSRKTVTRLESYHPTISILSSLLTFSCFQRSGMETNFMR